MARRVLVTGASSGIGAATAVAFGRTGARVALTYHSGKDRADLVAARVIQAGGEAIAVQLRLEEPESAADTVAAVEREWGGVDVLVANAVQWGTVPPFGARFDEVPLNEWRQMLDANVVGNVALAQAVLPHMRAGRWGRIVFVSSGAAEEGVPGPGPYGSAKAALHGLARALAWEAGDDGVLVNVVAAGLTLTERDRPIPAEVLDSVASRTPAKRLSTAEDVAGLIVYLGSAANANLTGEIVREGSNAGRSAHLP